MEPYDPVPVMVHYDGDILVPLPVRGLIDAYVDESVKPFLKVRLYVLPGS